MSDVIKNLDWARQRVARRVHFNQFESDEAFSGPQSDTWNVIDDALNEAGTDIINRAGTSCDPDYFKQTIPYTWTTNAITVTLPQGVDRVSLLEMRDITMGFPGVQVRPSFGYNSTSEIYWSGWNTVTWGVQGPPTDKSILFTAVMGWKILKDPLDEPFFIPYRFRDMWPLQACILLREDIDEDNVPQLWYRRMEMLEFSFHDEINQRSEGGSYNSPTKSAILP